MDAEYTVGERGAPIAEEGAPATTEVAGDNSGTGSVATSSGELSGQPDAPLTVAPPHTRPARIPHFGHAVLMGVLLLGGLVSSIVFFLIALHFHFRGIASIDLAAHDMAYNLGAMLFLYLFAFVPGAAVFPYLWGEALPAGLQWNASVAVRLRWFLMGTGVCCFGLAVALKSLLHFPKDSPIQGMLNSPSAAWMMAAFAVMLAPLCEEIIFRGFLLPATCTACDWAGEKLTGRRPPALLPNGHPQWSLAAMVAGAALTSALFALVHSGQTGKGYGPIVLLWCVSLILSAVRLKTRSLAASTLTHASYNCSLFVMMFITTSGFRHLGK